MPPTATPVFPPVGLFGSVMGITGLGLVMRDGSSGRDWLAETFVIAGLAVLVLLVLAYALKCLRAAAAVREEWTQPSQLGFCGTVPLALILAAGGISLYSATLAEALWGSGVTLMIALQVWALARWLSGGIELAAVNGAWMVVLVGGVVVPAVGLPLGHPDMSRYLFGVSAAAAPFVMTLVFYRTFFGPPLPEAMRPTRFIFLVPPSLIYANGMALAGEPPGVPLTALFYFSLALAAALLVAARGFLRWPYGPAWWAFTFPLDALAYAAWRNARLQPTPLWEGVAVLVLALAFVAVLVVSCRAIVHHARRPQAASAAGSQAA